AAPVMLLLLFAVVAQQGSGLSSEDAGGLMCCLGAPFYLVYTFGALLYLWAAYANYAMVGGFGAFFDVGGIFRRIRGNGYFAAWFFAYLGAALWGAVLLIPFLGWIALPFAYYLSFMTIGHLMGQYARRAYT
ncbi:MAG: DUF4013 domain-containing protein, partial [Coriobacteriales bacterium]|nr:DUF4013 domain-containing protein [Coriobacteriales bacterium]